MLFGDNLREIRIHLKMSQPELAVALKTTVKSISAYERNVALPHPKNLAKIAAYFHTKPEILMSRTGVSFKGDTIISNNIPIRMNVSPAEAKLIDYFRMMDFDGKESFLNLARIHAAYYTYRLKLKEKGRGFPTNFPDEATLSDLSGGEEK